MDLNVDDTKEKDTITNQFVENDKLLDCNKGSNFKQSEVSQIVQEIQKELDKPCTEVRFFFFYVYITLKTFTYNIHYTLLNVKYYYQKNKC